MIALRVNYRFTGLKSCAMGFHLANSLTEQMHPVSGTSLHAVSRPEGGYRGERSANL